MSCQQCGQDHSNQISMYPKDTRIFTLGSLLIPNVGTIPDGSIGIVQGHCDDGRAIFEIQGTVHTFHYPDGYVRLEKVVQE